jgi:hypothetical protein
LGGIGVVILLGTSADLYQLYFPEDSRWLKNYEGNEVINELRVNFMLKQLSFAGNDPFLMKILKCFSLRINYARVLYEDSINLDVDLRCLYGFDVISVIWIILGNTFFVAGQFPLKNPMKFYDLILGRTTLLGEAVVNAPIVMVKFLVP